MTDSDPASAVVEFVIEADAEADALARITLTLSLANCLPSTFIFHRAADAILLVTARVEIATASQAELIRRKLQQLTCVRHVVTLSPT